MLDPSRLPERRRIGQGRVSAARPRRYRCDEAGVPAQDDQFAADVLGSALGGKT
jgi:hypothetical protein